MVPRTEYVRDWRTAGKKWFGWRTVARVVGNARLAVFLGGLVLAWLAFSPQLLSPWWVVVPFLGFTGLLFLHERVTRTWHRAGQAYNYYQRGLARLDDTWTGKGQTGERFLDPNHPYAADLDLFGTNSLFELLCTVRGATGEDTLAAWLLGAAGADEVHYARVPLPSWARSSICAKIWRSSVSRSVKKSGSPRRRNDRPASILRAWRGGERPHRS